MTDSTRFVLTPAGAAALDAANLQANLPTVFDAVRHLAATNAGPAEIARRAGGSDTQRRQIENAARHLQANR